MIKLIIKDGQHTVWTGFVAHRLDGVSKAYKALGIREAKPSKTRFPSIFGREVVQELPSGYHALGNIRIREYPNKLLIMMDYSVTL